MKVGKDRRNPKCIKQLLTVDHSARGSMKTAASCVSVCESQEYQIHRQVERTLRRRHSHVLPSLLHEGRISHTCIGFVALRRGIDRLGEFRRWRSLKMCSSADALCRRRWGAKTATQQQRCRRQSLLKPVSAPDNPCKGGGEAKLHQSKGDRVGSRTSDRRNPMGEGLPRTAADRRNFALFPPPTWKGPDYENDGGPLAAAAATPMSTSC